MAVGLGWWVIACKRLRYLLLVKSYLTRNNNRRKTNNSRRVAAPIATGLRTSGGRPQTTPAGAGAIRVRHREFIKNITSDHTFESGVLALGINVGDTEMFPWLSKIANGYERYCVNSMTISYEPFVSTTESGAVIMQVDYDPADEAPKSKSNMLNSQGATRSAVWMKSAMPLNRKELSYDTHLFVRHAVRAGFAENLKLYDVGTAFIAVTDAPGTTARSYGEIWVSYDITLMVPAFHGSTPDAAKTLVCPATYQKLLGSIESNDPTSVYSGTSVNFETADNGLGETALTFNEPFTGIVWLEQSGYADDNFTHLELEPTTAPADGWIDKLVKLGGTITEYVMSSNKWMYMFEVVADAGESLVLDALAAGAGDISTWIGDVAFSLAPYAESLMLPLLVLTADNDLRVQQRIQSKWLREELPADEVLPRKIWVENQVKIRSKEECGQTDTAGTNVV